MTLNDRISSLGPPRNGRVVRDSKEVIKELEEQNRSGTLEPVLIKGAEGIEGVQESSLHGNGTLEFQAGDLRMTPDGNFQLFDLDVPEGNWARLLLNAEPALEGAAISWGEWSRWSNPPSPREFAVPGIEVGSVICPIKTLYWFMRAAYEQKDRTNSTDADRFQRFIEMQMGLGGWHHADLFLYRPKDDMDVVTHAITLGHPLHYSFIHRSLAGNLKIAMKTPGAGLGEFLGRFLGDNDPEHVNSVLSWCAGKPEKNNGYIMFPELDSKGSYCGALGMEDEDHYKLAFTEETGNQKPAHFIWADPSHFTRKKMGNGQ